MAQTISASVGIHGKNLSFDTETVQNLLNKVPVSSGGPKTKLDPDGKCGPLTINAIQVFQVKQFGWSGADGRVDPDGPTILMLNIFSPDPVLPAPPILPPTPEPLSNNFMIWLRHKPKFFSHPYDVNEFVLTVIDLTNSRDAAYGLRFNGKVGAALPGTGSGGHIAKVQLKKPVGVSGLGGDGVYQTIVDKGDGLPVNRLVSKLFVFIGSGNGFVAPFDCHLLKATPDGQQVMGASDPSANGSFVDGRFNFNLQCTLVKL